MRRYRTAGNWTTVDTRPITAYCDGPLIATLIIEVSDAVDTKHGDVYTDGFRRATVKVGSSKRSKSFVGETAYNDCERWLNDIVWEVAR